MSLFRANTAQQHRRLVNRDFPWLWQVRSEWYFGNSRCKIKVQIIDQELLELLYCECSADCEFWVYEYNYHRPGHFRDPSQDSVARVRKVEFDVNEHKCWAQSILLSKCLYIKHIVLIRKLHLTERIIIFRAPKEKDFFDIISEVARRRTKTP